MADELTKARKTIKASRKQQQKKETFMEEMDIEP